MRGAGGALPQRQLRRRGREALGRLFEAAEEVFAESGYHAARIEDVVARSGMARTTFYEYFGTKEDLFQAMVAEAAAAMREHAAGLGPLDPGPRGRAMLRDWLAGFVGLYAEHARLLQVWTEAEVASSDLGTLGTDVLGDVVASFASAIRDRTDVDADVAALALVTMTERVSYYATAGLLDVAHDDLVDALTDIVHAALGGR